MPQMPTIEMCIRGFGEQLNSMMAVHHQEIEQYLRAGIERTLGRIGEDLIEEACKLATQKIHGDVKHYLLYGEGGKRFAKPCTMPWRR